MLHAKRRFRVVRLVVSVYWSSRRKTGKSHLQKIGTSHGENRPKIRCVGNKMCASWGTKKSFEVFVSKSNCRKIWNAYEFLFIWMQNAYTGRFPLSNDEIMRFSGALNSKVRLSTVLRGEKNNSKCLRRPYYGMKSKYYIARHWCCCFLADLACVNLLCGPRLHSIFAEKWIFGNYETPEVLSLFDNAVNAVELLPQPSTKTIFVLSLLFCSDSRRHVPTTHTITKTSHMIMLSERKSCSCCAVPVAWCLGARLGHHTISK